MVRPKNQQVWQHFNETENKSVTCNHCNKKYQQGHLQKMYKHLLKCHKCPESYKMALRSQPNMAAATTSSNILHRVIDRENIPPDELSSQTSSCAPSTTVSASLSNKEIEELHSSFSKAVYVTGTPLSMVEHPLWGQFFEKLQPLYKLPSRKAISTTYLDRTYKEMHQEITEDLRSKNYLHLQLDGWSNLRNEGVLNILIAKPEPVFVKSIETTDNRHTSEYICSQITNVLAEYGPNKFVTLIGDNARNMQRAFQMVNAEYPHITNLNCIAHTLHLLCKDIMRVPVIDAIKNMATGLIKTIKKSQVLSSLLSKVVKEKGVGESLKLPCDTRWGTYCTSLRSLQNTKIALQTLAVHENAALLPAEDKTTLLDEDFWRIISQCVQILQPLSDVIFTLESNDQNINKVFLSLKNMKSRFEFCLPDISMLEDDTKQDILSTIDSRINMCLKPIHYAAYLLDPVHQGAELSESQTLDAMEYITEMGNNSGLDVLPSLANYRAKEGLWSRRFVWQNLSEINAVVWWKGICSTTALSKIAVQILTAPCTSAAVERSFSTQSNIHNKKRNRLTTERAAKLAYISYNWNLLHKFEENSISSTTLARSSTGTTEPRSSTTSNDFEFLDCENVPDYDDD